MEKILRHCSKTLPWLRGYSKKSDPSEYCNMTSTERPSLREWNLVEILRSYFLKLPYQLFALFIVSTLGAFHVAHAQQAHIAILSPSSESYYALSEYIVAGAEFALRDTEDVWLEVVDVDFSDHLEVAEVFDDLASDDTDVVIGGLTPESATKILLVAMNHDVPTILLSAPNVWMPGLQQQSVIQLGFSDPAIYRLGLRHWIEQEDISRAQVIYRGDSEPSFSLGAKISPYLFDNIFSDRDVFYELTDIAPSASDSAGYMDYFSGSPDHSGIVLAGLSDERDSVLNTLTNAILNIYYDDASVFLANPQSAPANVSSVANRTSLPSYSASQFWLDPATSTLHRDFIDNLEEHTDEWHGKLPWLDGNFALSAAAKAHDGVKVAVSALASAGSTWNPTRTPWPSVLNRPVQGISGELEFLGPYVIAGPVRFISVRPNEDIQTTIIDIP